MKEFDQSIILNYLESISLIYHITNVHDASSTTEVFNYIQHLIYNEFVQKKSFEFDFSTKYFYFLNKIAKIDKELLSKFKNNFVEYLNCLNREIEPLVNLFNKDRNFEQLTSIFSFANLLGIEESCKNLLSNLVKLLSPNLMNYHIHDHSLDFKNYLVRDKQLYQGFTKNLNLKLNSNLSNSNRTFKLLSLLNIYSFYLDQNPKIDEILSILIPDLSNKSDMIEFYPNFIEILCSDTQYYVNKYYQNELTNFLLKNFKNGYVDQIKNSMPLIKLWLNFNQFIFDQKSSNYKELIKKRNELNYRFMNNQMFIEFFVVKILNLAEDGYFFNNQGIEAVQNLLVHGKYVTNYIKSNPNDVMILFLFNVIQHKAWNVTFDSIL